MVIIQNVYRCCLLAVLALFTLVVHSSATFAAKSDDAIALLQTRCWTCHGPDRQRSDLRLDSVEFIQLGGKSGNPAAISHNSSKSLLIEKITSTDPKKRMPATGPPLTTDEVELLTNWINDGLTWPAHIPPPTSTHWAFISPVKASIPEKPSINPIDHFVQARLSQEGLSPTPEADRYTLIRRASLEITGLPPTPEEVFAFVDDKKSGAYGRLIDRLFASPHYGERQARRWLDAARYSDTNGYEKDRPRSIWPWRDWVIQAYNDNMPYDQFVTEQLAGDLLPDPTESQLVATGFHRNTMFNEEGGIDAAEDWFKRTLDRTNTNGTLFLGMTVSCAQCHNHKFDPLSRREYYNLFAFFNDAQEATLPLLNPEVESKRKAVQAQIDDLAAQMIRQTKRDSTIQSEFQAWVQSAVNEAGAWTPVAPDLAISKKDATLAILDDASVLATQDIPNDDTYTLEFEDVSGAVSALRLEVLPHESLPGGGPGRGTILAEGDFLLTGLEMYSVATDGQASPISIDQTSHDYAAENRSAEQALDGKSDTGWSIKGQTGKAHRAVFTFSEALPLGTNLLRLVLHQDYIHQHTLGRIRVSFTTEPEPKAAAQVPAHIEKILSDSRDSISKDDRNMLREYYALEVAPQLSKSRKKRTRLGQEKPKRPTTLVMSSRIPPRETHMYTRGEFLNPRGTVEPDVPKILHPLEENAELNRLTFAHWLTDSDNPLFARVAMNRLWQQVFGTGLVSTSEDFGTQGARPSHPELLDWLAVEFMDSGWNMKYMHRLMVSSEAYRRDSSISSEHLERDPVNTLLTRGPRFRLQAEMIRDLALSTAGLLNLEIGGPSVYPPQPPGVTSLGYQNAKWPTSSGADRYRRGLYTYMLRTTPYAGFIVFDAPTSEEACVRRERSNTPLQALTLLNDQVMLEASQSLARRVLNSSDELDEQIDTLYLICLSRYPDKNEQHQIAQFYAQTLEQLADYPKQARYIAGPIGWFAGRDVTTQATWATISRAILNLDETISQR